MQRELLAELIKNAQGLSVLYVEDDVSARDAGVEFLKTFFGNVEVAENGQEGLELFKSKKIDLVLTDINMPKMSGLEMIEHIRALDENVPVVILSAYNDTEYFLHTIKLGVDGYLLKPLDIKLFYNIISKIVNRLQRDAELRSYQEDLKSKIKEKTQELEHRCLHEYYTDLPNSLMLNEDLVRHKYEYMLLLDMSHFSVINKEYGKDFANHVIVRTARVLEKHIHKNAKLYKTESDRFVILLRECNEDQVYMFCEQIVAFFDAKNVRVDDAELHITFNIGADKVRADVSETLINCEYALDKSKELGSRHFEIFSDETSIFKDEKEAVKWLRLTRELILSEQIEPYFQPIEDIQTGKILKYEVLARGFLGDEVIPPIYFISPAEKLGLSTAITRMIINKSFAYFQDKKESFSINLTERDLLEGYLVDFLNAKLEQFDIEPERITFEILENITVAKNSKRITEELNLLQSMGFKIAIDDFGIENSNFSRLLEINLDFIKIDGVFIKHLKHNERNRMITRAIVNLAKTLDIKTIAEFVEDEEVYEIVKECGINYAQGYHVGRPAPEII